MQKGDVVTAHRIHVLQKGNQRRHEQIAMRRIENEGDGGSLSFWRSGSAAFRIVEIKSKEP